MDEKKQRMGSLERLFIGISTAKMLDFLMEFREFDYSEADISRKACLSARQVYRALPLLEAMGLVYQTRKSGRSKMYKLNTNSKAIQHLEKFVYTLSELSIAEKSVGRIPIQSILPEKQEKAILPQSN